jgi:hypothetical protein
VSAIKKKIKEKSSATFNYSLNCCGGKYKNLLQPRDMHGTRSAPIKNGEAQGFRPMPLRFKVALITNYFFFAFFAAGFFFAAAFLGAAFFFAVAMVLPP